MTPPPAVGYKTVRDVQDATDDVYVLGLREFARPDSWSLLFMAGEPDADPDDDLGSYCLVVDPGQATMYGGVTACSIETPASGHVLRLKLTAEASETLDLPAESALSLELTPAGLELLRRGLRRVLTSGRPVDTPDVLSV